MPLDGSQVAEKALKAAETVAESDGATVHLVRVVHPVMASTYPFRAVPVTGRSDGEGEIKRHAQRYLEDRAAALRARGVTTATEVRVSTRPAMEVLDSVRETGADLVSMTTQGHGGAARLLLGSVADKVLRGAEVPVLLHRTEAPEGSG